MKSIHEIEDNHIITDDLAFSAFLKMKGYQLIKLDSWGKKTVFVFQLKADKRDSLKMEFVKSEFLDFYNELRNLKKLI